MTKPTTRISAHGDARLRRRQSKVDRAGDRRPSIGFGEALATLLSFKS